MNSELNIPGHGSVVVDLPYNKVPVWIRQRASVQSSEAIPTAQVVMEVNDYGHFQVNTIVGVVSKGGLSLLKRSGSGYRNPRARHYFKTI